MFQIKFLKIQKSPGVAVHAVSPSIGRQRYVDICELEAQPGLQREPGQLYKQPCLEKQDQTNKQTKSRSKELMHFKLWLLSDSNCGF